MCPNGCPAGTGFSAELPLVRVSGVSFVAPLTSRCKAERRPQEEAMVGAPRTVLAPGPLDDTRVDSRIGAGASRRIDLAQPLRKRNAESLLGAVEDRRVEVARERLAQQIFAASVAQLEPVRQARA